MKKKRKQASPSCLDVSTVSKNKAVHNEHHNVYIEQFELEM